MKKNNSRERNRNDNIKKIVAIILIIAMVGMTIFMTAGMAFADDEDNAEPDETEETEAAEESGEEAEQAEENLVTAEGAVLYCENTGEIVYEKNMEKSLNPLDITKLMTALLAIQNLSMDQEVTVSAAAVAQPGHSMGLQEGETVTVKDLIHGVLLCSGNDAAYAISEAVSGSAESFVDLMNATAANIGCENTWFANPMGIVDKNNYSTAYDMMQIAKVALSNPIISEASQKKDYVVKATNLSDERTIVNSMAEMMDSRPGIYAP